eukprot:7816058-Karenia_brevis.AAC.1
MHALFAKLTLRADALGVDSFDTVRERASFRFGRNIKRIVARLTQAIPMRPSEHELTHTKASCPMRICQCNTTTLHRKGVTCAKLRLAQVE